MSSTTELQAWLNGTANGGPNGDGRYPLTYKDGQVHLVLCPAAQPLDPNIYDTLLRYSGVAPDGQVGQWYSHNYSIIGGVGPFTHVVKALPNGLSAAINGALLTIQGDPSSAENNAFINITVRDSQNKSVTVSDVINVAPYIHPIEVLFANNEQGIWLDPSDFERYTARGPNLVSNGDFSDGATGWVLSNATMTITNGVARVQNTAASYGCATRSFTCVVGKTYIASVRVVTANNTSGLLSVGDGPGNLTHSSSGANITFTATQTTMWVSLYAGGNVSGNYTDFDDVVVGEVDLSTATMFQDSAGTTPVTAVEQPVGLILDKRLGAALGPELVTSLIAGAPNHSISEQPNGSIRITALAGAAISNALTHNGPMTLSGSGVQTVELSFEIVARSSAAVLVYSQGYFVVDAAYAGQCNANWVGSLGTHKRILSASATATTTAYIADLGFGIGNNYGDPAEGDWLEIRNISVRELPGNHASQSTSASRPVLSARKNLWLKTEDYADATWTKYSGASVSGSVVDLPANDGGLYNTAPLGVGAGIPHTVSFRVRRNGAVDQQFRILTDGVTFAGPFTATAEDQWFSVTFIPGGSGGAGLWAPVGSAASLVVTGAQREYGSIRTTYQRVNTATDYDTEGFLEYQKFDGVDDGIGTGTFAAGTFGSNMDCFMLVRRDSDAAMILANTVPEVSGGGYFGCVSGTTEAANENAGFPSYYVNGVAVAGGAVPTRTQLNAAIPVGGFVVVEVRNLNLSSWVAFRIGGAGGYGGFLLNGAITEVVLAPAQSAESRTAVREYLAAKAGVTLP